MTRGRLHGLVPALPPFAWLCLFFVVPTGIIAAFSFGESVLFGASPVDLSRPDLDRYREAASETFRVAFVNTVTLASVGTVLCLALAFPMAYLIATRLRGGWKYAAVLAIVVPYWMPFLLRTYSWRILLGDHGPLSRWFPEGGLGVLDTMAGAQLGVVYNYLPLAVLPILVSLDRLDPALRHSARDLGAPPGRAFWQVTVPAVRPGLISASALVFIPLMGDYVTPAVLGGVKSYVVGSLIYDSFLATQDWALGAAAAMLLILLDLGLLVGAWLAIAVVGRGLRWARPLDVVARWSSPMRRPTWDQGWTLLLRGYGVGLVTFLWAPILTILVFSFNSGQTLPVWQGASPRWYAAIADNPELGAALGVSLRVAALSTVVAVVLGTLAGAALARAGKPIRWTLNILLLVVFVTPEIVSAVGLLLLYVTTGAALSDGTVRLVIAHSVFSVVVVAFVVAARLASLDPNLPAAAADLGATGWGAFRQVVLPLAAPAVAAAAVLASTFSLDDVVSSSLVGTVGTTTLPVYIYSSLRTGLKGDAAAAAVLLMLGTALAVALFAWLLSRRGNGGAFARALVGDS